MPFHLGPAGVPYSSFWRVSEPPPNETNHDTDPCTDLDTLSSFLPEPPRSLGYDAGVPAARLIVERSSIEPMLLAAQSRLTALTADLDQLRALTARISDECRRMELASREAARDLERRRMAQRELAPMVMEPAPAFEASLSEFAEPGDRERERQAAEWRWARETREKSTAWNPRRTREGAARDRGGRGAETCARALAERAGQSQIQAVVPNRDGVRRAARRGRVAGGQLDSGQPPGIRDPVQGYLAPPAQSAPSAEVSSTALATRVASVAPFSGGAREPKRTVVPVRTVPVAAGPVFQGTLSVYSEPAGAAVYVNQTYVGDTPLKLPRLRAGSHVVRVEGEGYQRWSAGVLVPADKVTNIRVNLERDHQ